MSGRRSEPDIASAARPGLPDAGEALERLGDGLARAGWTVILTGPDGCVVWVRQPAGATGTWTPGTKLDDLVFPEPREGGTGQEPLLRSRGTPALWFRAIAVPWDGGMVHLLSECTAEVERQRERRKRDVYLSRALEDSVDAIVSLDTGGVIQYWNHGAERMFGYHASEVIGRPYDLLVPVDLVREGELERLQEVIERQGELRNFETTRLARGGGRVEVGISVTQIRDEAGHSLGRSVIYRDISLRRRLEEEQQRLQEELSAKVGELRAANRTLRRSQEKLLSMEKLSAIGEMAAKVAHEIRTPLVTIGGFSNTLWKSMPETAPEREYLAIIRDEVRRLEDIVAEILNYVKPGPPETEPCDVNQLVMDSLRPHQEQMVDAGIHVEMDLAASLPPVNVNRNQVRQILTNLLVNAMQAVQGRPPRRGAAIDISTGQGPNHVVISVGDNGAGIPERHRERIFRPFFTTKPGGSGLGLAIASKIAEHHRATLTFESDPGRGTVFHLRLPCGEPAARGNPHEDDPGR